jgi:hypothetical protein
VIYSCSDKTKDGIHTKICISSTATKNGNAVLKFLSNVDITPRNSITYKTILEEVE